MLGVMLFYGHGVEANATLSADWFKRAAAQGHALARGNLALMHEHGIGVPLDLSRAQQLLQQATEADPRNAQAAWLFGKFLFEGKSTLPQTRAHALSKSVRRIRSSITSHLQSNVFHSILPRLRGWVTRTAITTWA